jgi:hypothetical protein
MWQAVSGSGKDKRPVVILGEKNGREMLALIRLDDLLDILSEAVEGPQDREIFNYGGTD